jgi:hypothetical protein
MIKGQVFHAHHSLTRKHSPERLGSVDTCDPIKLDPRMNLSIQIIGETLKLLAHYWTGNVAKIFQITHSGGVSGSLQF